MEMADVFGGTPENRGTVGLGDVASNL